MRGRRGSDEGIAKKTNLNFVSVLSAITASLIALVDDVFVGIHTRLWCFHDVVPDVPGESDL
jgi:hypothetical protein